MRYEPARPKRGNTMFEHAMMYPMLIRDRWRGRCSCGWVSHDCFAVGEARFATQQHIKVVGA